MARGKAVVSKTLVAIKDKPSEPELEGNIRTTAWASASARQAVENEDDQMSTGTSLRRCTNYQEFR